MNNYKGSDFMNILAVIPARGGSKGIPRKNLRLLNGKPLIFYSINNALNSKYITDVYVSSDDEEILHLAQKFGAKLHKRDKNIADDKTTLDPVIYACYEYAKEVENKQYDIIITMQPTSPLLKASSVDLAIEKIIKNKIDTIISVQDSTHLSWKRVDNKYIPNYEKRVNRQYLTPTYTETGGFLITNKETISPTNRIGKNVDLFVLNSPQSIDIDTYEDWNLCEYYLKRKHILFVVTGNDKVGLGHVYNTLILANDILNHQVSFLVDKDSKLAYEKIKSRNYPVFIQQSDNIITDIQKLSPDVIINDRLDTSSEYIKELKQLNYKVINFEDLGDGAKEADLVINAIYPENEIIPKHYFGHDYFVLRDEFVYSQQKEIKDVKNVLITFGGVDPNNYTKKVIDSIYSFCKTNNITIDVIAGFGYNKYETLQDYDVNFYKNVLNISDYMLKADIIFTSAGRTVYEIASIGTPAIVLAQNERELTHFFASSKHGFVNLGLGVEVSNEQILSEFKHLINSTKTREKMSNLMKSHDLKMGRKRVIELIQNEIGAV
jgi:CMP-N-acetylneuraminic acid synthetase/spore coat polysaccharide biosynthesis predicted glycosyltransferase SpsG